MTETSLHAELVLTLREWLLRSSDIELTHIAGESPLPDPVKIGRHEPDLLARSRATGRLIIGEAKTGDDFDRQTTREQFEDFSRHKDSNGERATFWVCVPSGFRYRALKAIRAVGEDHPGVDVLCLAGIAPTNTVAALRHEVLEVLDDLGGVSLRARIATELKMPIDGLDSALQDAHDAGDIELSDLQVRLADQGRATLDSMLFR